MLGTAVEVGLVGVGAVGAVLGVGAVGSVGLGLGVLPLRSTRQEELVWDLLDWELYVGDELKAEGEVVGAVVVVGAVAVAVAVAVEEL